MAQLFKNNADSTLASGISTSALSLTVASGDGAKFPSPTGSDYFLLTIFKVSGISEFSWEIVKVTARSTDTLTIVRAQEGTSATAFDADDRVSLRWTAAAATNALQSTENLADLDDAAVARTNLGLGTAAEADAGDFMAAANNLSELTDAADARNNLGLGTAAVLAATAVLQAANNLSDLASASAARSSLGLGTAAVTAATDYATAAQGTTADAALPKAGGTLTGLVTTAATTGDIADASGSLAKVNVIGASGAGNGAFIGFNRTGVFAAYFGLDSNSDWCVGGWTYGAVKYKVWHEGNLDTADYVATDGSHPMTAALPIVIANDGDPVLTFERTGAAADEALWSWALVTYSGLEALVLQQYADDGTTLIKTPIAFTRDATTGDATISLGARAVSATTSDDGIHDLQVSTGRVDSLESTTVTADDVLAGQVTAVGVDFGAVTDDGSSSTSKTIDFSAAQYHKLSMTGNCTFTFTAPAGPCVVQLELTQSTGSHTMTLPASVKWPGNYTASDKLLSTAASARDLLILRWNGTDYVANLIKGIA
jgi:hypothetical protein